MRIDMNIVTDQPWIVWTAIDMDTYDGETRIEMGTGATEQEAIESLLLQLEEYENDQY